MKKALTTLLSGLALAILIPASTFAASAKTDVTGTVTNNGSPVSGAHVIVICNSNKKTDTTDSQGDYLVVFNAKACPAGSNISVTATKGHKGGFDTGKAKPETTKLNVALINVALPELGAIAAAGAAVLGGATFFVIRRRQLNGTNV